MSSELIDGLFATVLLGIMDDASDLRISDSVTHLHPGKPNLDVPTIHRIPAMLHDADFPFLNGSQAGSAVTDFRNSLIGVSCRRLMSFA